MGRPCGPGAFGALLAGRAAAVICCRRRACRLGAGALPIGGTTECSARKSLAAMPVIDAQERIRRGGIVIHRVIQVSVSPRPAAVASPVSPVVSPVAPVSVT